MNPIKKTIALPDGRTITLETGKLAKQADGAVELRMGNTMLLATVCSAKEAGEGVDFMPLTVEYKEKFSSNGRFPGGFTKREGRAGHYVLCRWSGYARCSCRTCSICRHGGKRHPLQRTYLGSTCSTR